MVTSVRSPGRVLAAVQDPQLRAAIVGACETGEQTEWMEAGDAAQVWSRLSAELFDVALLDAAMPGIDVRGLTRMLRNNPRSRQMPLMVILPEGDLATAAACLTEGASMVMTQPLMPPLVAMQVQALWRQQAGHREIRTAASRDTARHRAIEAVLGNLAGEASLGTAWLHGEIAALRAIALPPEVAAPVSRHIERIARECRALQLHTCKAMAAVRDLSDMVVADDRHECLADVVRGVLETIRPAAEERRVRVTTAMPSGMTRLMCDGDGLERALGQLLANAIAHADPASEVGLNASVYPDGLLAIEVTDHGPGMHPEVLSRTAAPLQSRVDGSRAGPYMGFGLLFAKAIAEAHGGSLELRSMPGQGTTVLMAMPPYRVMHLP